MEKNIGSYKFTKGLEIVAGGIFGSYGLMNGLELLPYKDIQGVLPYSLAFMAVGGTLLGDAIHTGIQLRKNNWQIDDRKQFINGGLEMGVGLLYLLPSFATDGVSYTTDSLAGRVAMGLTLHGIVKSLASSQKLEKR